MCNDKMPRSKEVSDKRILAVIRIGNGPVMTTPEIAAELPISRTAVANRLEELEGQDRVKRKKPNRDVFYWVD